MAVVYHYLERENGKVLEFHMCNFSYFEIFAFPIASAAFFYASLFKAPNLNER